MKRPQVCWEGEKNLKKIWQRREKTKNRKLKKGLFFFTDFVDHFKTEMSERVTFYCYNVVFIVVCECLKNKEGKNRSGKSHCDANI